MVVYWNIHPEHRLVSFDISGESTVLDSLDSLRAVADDPAFRADFRRLYRFRDDLSAPASIDSTQGAFVDILARQVTRMFSSPATAAFVFGNDNSIARHRYTVTTAMCDQIFRDQGKPPMEHRRFSNVSDALAWLGLPQDFTP